MHEKGGIEASLAQNTIWLYLYLCLLLHMFYVFVDINCALNNR